MAKLLIQPKDSQPQWCYIPYEVNTVQVIKNYPLDRNTQLDANTWVQLLELPNDWCDDEALLLCPHSKSEWVAWIPGYGETILSYDQFCFQPQWS